MTCGKEEKTMRGRGDKEKSRKEVERWEGREKKKEGSRKGKGEGKKSRKEVEREKGGGKQEMK